MANNTGLKFGGRSKGTPNRTTKETRDALKKIIDNELDQLPELLRAMKPHQRIEIFTRLLQYVIPKPETKGNEDTFKHIQIIPIDLRKNKGG